MVLQHSKDVHLSQSITEAFPKVTEPWLEGRVKASQATNETKPFQVEGRLKGQELLRN